jgi:malonate-semialdehyde dehydrogenase (acetylating)/methylmalonate-semialdehyde dehydrogenase
MMIRPRLIPLRTSLVRGYAAAAPARLQRNAGASAGLSPLAQAAAEEVTAKWRGTSALGGKTKNYIGGEFVESKADKWLEVRDPVSAGGVREQRRAEGEYGYGE